MGFSSSRITESLKPDARPPGLLGEYYQVISPALDVESKVRLLVHRPLE
jgi:hypothetical protein